MISRKRFLKLLQRAYENDMKKAKFYRDASLRAKNSEDFFLFDGQYLAYLDSAMDIKELRRCYEIHERA